MDPSWLVRAGKVSLYVFYAYVGAALTAIVFRRALEGSRVRPATVPHSGEAGAPRARGSKLARFFLEYVGNVDLRERGLPGGERRRNRQARILMNHIKEVMTRRELAPAEAERLMEELRESMQTEGREQTG